MPCSKQPNVTVVSDRSGSLISQIQDGALSFCFHGSLDVGDAEQAKKFLKRYRHAMTPAETQDLASTGKWEQCLNG